MTGSTAQQPSAGPESGADSESGAQVGVLSILRSNPAARQLAASVLVNNIGNGAQTIGTALLIFQITGKAYAVGAVFAAEFLISFVGQVFVGSILNRASAVRVAVLTDRVRGATVLTAAAWISLRPSLIPILCTLVVLNLCRPLYRVATFTITPELARAGQPIATLNSLRATALQGGQIIGVGIAGLIVAFLPIVGTFWFNGLSFLASAVILKRIVVAPRVAARATLLQVLQDWAQGLAFLVRGRRARLHLLTCTLGPALVGVVNVVLVPLVHLRHQPNWYVALLDGSFATGAVLSVFAVGYLIRLSVPGCLTVTTFGVSVGLLCWALFPYLPTSVLGLALMGAMVTMQVSVVNGAIQERTDRAGRSRIGVVLDISGSVVGASVLGLASLLVGVAGVLVLLYVTAVFVIGCTVFFVLARRRLNQAGTFVATIAGDQRGRITVV